MAEYLGALDQGTTSTRFMVFDRSGKVISSARKEHKQIYPAPGFVEHRPLEIWQRTLEVIEEACASRGLGPADIACIGITNQRETTVIWDRKTGEPVTNALVWQDTRVGEYTFTLDPDRHPKFGMDVDAKTLKEEAQQKARGKKRQGDPVDFYSLEASANIKLMYRIVAGSSRLADRAPIDAYLQKGTPVPADAGEVLMKQIAERSAKTLEKLMADLKLSLDPLRTGSGVRRSFGPGKAWEPLEKRQRVEEEWN